ncbi:MAG: hypothetical protein IKU85_00110 [Bacteroidaceae bacterium]|nr:hypothetical protein [Bacteroidaceae bacterium]
MKKNFTKVVLLALAVTSMGTFNSCKDHDDCGIDRIELGTLKDKNAKLEEVVKTQTSQIEELIKQIEAIKECNCTLTPEQVQKMIDDAIANMVSADEFTSMVLEIINKMGFQTADQVTAAIEKYMAEHPNTGDGTGLTAEQIQQMINTATEKLATQEALEKAVAGLEAALKEANEKTESVDGKVDNLAQVVNDLNIAATQAIAQLQTLITDLGTEVGTLKSEVETLKSQLNEIITAWGPKVEEAIKTAADALALAQSNSTQITTMQEQYEALSAKLDSLANLDHTHNPSYDDTELRNSIAALAEEMKDFASKQALRDVLTAAELMHAEAMEYTKRVENMAAEKLGELENNFTTLEATVAEIKAKVDEIYPKVQENRQYIIGIYDYLKKMITGITIQAVNNPVFGSFAFPWGVQSNILVGYYGESDVDVRFPTTRTANYIYKECALTDKDAEMLGSSVESYNKFGQPVLVEETEGNAGKVYVTINPTSVDFTGQKLPLVNSQDEESAVKLGALEKSDAVLRFGVTRAANNGFYEATATFTEDNIPTYDVDKSMIYNSLKDIAKDVLNHQDGINVKAAASRLYNVFLELNGNLDAYGIKASWNFKDVEGNVQTNSVYSKYAIAATAIKPLSYAFLYDMQLGTSINNRLPNLPTINPNVEAIINNIVDLDQLEGQIMPEVKDALELVKDQVVAGAGNYMDKAEPYINKLNYWTSRLNGYMERFEDVANNVNALLQVTMLYKGKDDQFHQLSNSKEYPTVFAGEGLANVFATSYTGEIIAPAFKKFIGVTNVFKDGDSAQNGCADCKAALDAVNDGEYFNEVFPGSRYGVAIENMKKGYTYEIFYSALDYSGKISARKFYVTVK